MQKRGKQINGSKIKDESILMGNRLVNFIKQLAAKFEKALEFVLCGQKFWAMLY